jgi:uncharacterized protein DUF4349/PKD domain-containing protein
VDRLGGITRRRALAGIAALIVVGGFGLALLSNSALYPGTSSVPLRSLQGSINGSEASYASNGVQGALGNIGVSYGFGNDQLNVAGQATELSTSTVTWSTTTSYQPGTIVTQTIPQAAGQSGTNVTQGSPGGAGGLIEFSTDLTIRTSAPEQTASAVSALAYGAGGYVAYQSTYSNSAYIVIRVPSADYAKVLNQVQALGTFISETSNSNDVSVQYTDMNASLMSLRTEQGALLRLLNESTAVNSTLAIENQLEYVNQQINEVESQILQTRTLVNYATIDVTVTQTAQLVPLQLTVSATPTNGTIPLSVTFNAVVKGGAQPYLVNYNFGDGYAAQGQIVIHTYFQAGNYKVIVSATDQNGTVAQANAVVRVVAAPAQSALGGFFGSVGNLLVNVLEGIVEVAVVVLPIAAVGAAVIIPIQRRGRGQKGVKQSQ